MKSRFTIFISILLVALFCLELANTLFRALYAQSPANNNTAVSPQSRAPSWYNQIVDDQGTAGFSNSIAIDSTGHPHISYTSFEGLKYARWTGNAWNIETVDALAPGYYNALDLDSTDRPHIAYLGLTDSSMAAVKYARWTGSSWEIENIDFVANSGDISLVLDDIDRPHIGYFEGGDGTGGNSDIGLKYVYWSGSGWDIELIDDVGIWSSSLALDSMGKPHIAYLDQVNADLKYAYRENHIWNIQVVDNQGEVGAYTSLAIDTANYPHIAYQDITNRHLKLAYWNGASWNIETIGGGGWFTSLALEPSGKPHIIHASDVIFANLGTLKHTYIDGNAWTSEIIEGAANVSRDTSLALNGDGYLHVSYHHEWPGYDLWYARTLPLLELQKSASSLENVHVGEVLTYTLTLKGTGTTVDLLDQLPDHVNYITDTLTYPAVYSPTIHAITWQGTLSSTAQIFQYQVVPTVEQMGAPDLSIPIVNSAWLTDTFYTRTAFEMIIVNGWRQYLPIVLNP